MRSKQTRPTCEGFTLIELLIVIAIIGILAGIAIPLYQVSVRKANEASAVGSLHSLRTAQAKYVIDHKGEYGTFPQLVAQGYLDRRFNADQPHHRGYIFIINIIPKSEGKAASFTANANPEQSTGIGATGGNFYYLDPDSGICVSTTGPATAADDTL